MRLQFFTSSAFTLLMALSPVSCQSSSESASPVPTSHLPRPTQLPNPRCAGPEFVGFYCPYPNSCVRGPICCPQDPACHGHHGDIIDNSSGDHRDGSPHTDLGGHCIGDHTCSPQLPELPRSTAGRSYPVSVWSALGAVLFAMLVSLF
jgi:hypothetical protein